MVTTLTGLFPGNTYKQLLQIGASNVGITGALQTVGDGEGNECPLQLSLSAVKINATSLTINGQTITLTGSSSVSGTHTGTSSGTNTGDQTIALTGDVTGSGTSTFAATIANSAVTTAKIDTGAVTYAKIQEAAAVSLIGNPTGSTAGVTDITLASSLAFSSNTLSTAAMSGDVTTSAGSFVTTIANLAVTSGKLNDLAVTTGKLNDLAVTTGKLAGGAVTYAKMQDVSNNKILGNTSGGSAAPSEISLPLVVGNGGSGVSSTTAYAVLCGGTTSTGALQSIASVGTSGQVLTSNGAGALPTFQTTTNPSAATQTEQEAASSTSVYVSPGTAVYNPTNCKSWVEITNTVVALAGYNVSSVSDTGTGCQVNYSAAFSSTSYGIYALQGQGSYCTASTQATTNCSINTRDNAGTPANQLVYIACFGDLS